MTTSPPMATDMIALTEAAQRLQVRYSAARDHMLCGRLGPAEQRGTRWYVSRAAVEAFAATRTTGHTHVVMPPAPATTLDGSTKKARRT